MSLEADEADLQPEAYTLDEIHKIFQLITVAQRTALVKIARVYAHATIYPGYEDLLNEAYARVLGGTRVWPRSVGTVPFLRNVMRSIASDWRDKGQSADVDVDSIPIENHSAEARVDMERIIAIFNDDPIAQRIILAMLEGLRGEELRETSGLTETEYQSKRRKIRRWLEKLAP
jgi:RNA polymerase sigma-70 factor (ECF subfamily)